MDLDATFLIQLGVFLFLFLLLRSLFFKPVIKLVEARHQATHVRRAEAEKLAHEAEELNAQIKQRLAESRATAQKERVELESQAQAESRAIVRQAREACLKLAADSRDQMTAQTEQVQATLQSEIESIGAIVVSKVLGRPI